jgi:NAD+ kinase
MNSIGLAPNPHKKEAVHLALELAEWLAERGVQALLTQDAAAVAGRPDLAASEDDVLGADMLLVLGGDGSMLRWSRLAAPRGTPMMGVNFGQYGFITEIHPDEAKHALAKIIDGECCISERVVLKAVVTRENGEIGTYHGLNDVVVSKGAPARMLGLHTYVNDKFIVTYAADGIIVASPTGSTAYSLSAGGPVVHPNVSVLIVTPICPHTLNARSLVVPDSEIITIACEAGEYESEMTLTVDGQVGEHLTCRDKVEIGKADFTAKLVQLEPQSFYNKLQTRLRWGERFSGQ